MSSHTSAVKTNCGTTFKDFRVGADELEMFALQVFWIEKYARDNGSFHDSFD